MIQAAVNLRAQPNTWLTRSARIGCAWLLFTLSACTQATRPAETNADLHNDALLAPAAPELEITAQAATLTLSWQGGSDSDTATLFRYDALIDREIIIADGIENHTAINSFQLPSNTHRTALHRQQYRVELCNGSDCVSSLRVSSAGLVAATTQQLSPSVFIQAERYGEHIASNTDASLVAIALPRQGAIDLMLQTNNLWTRTQRVQIAGLDQSASRYMKLALSASGDTLAVFIIDSVAGHEVRILERLGEAWFETASPTLHGRELETAPDFSNSEEFNPISATNLSLSDNENRLLLRLNSQVWIIERSDTGWSDNAIETINLNTSTADTDELSPAQNSNTLAATGNDAIDRIQSIERHNGQLWLNDWQRGNQGSNNGIWVLSSRTIVTGMNSERQALINANHNGDHVVIAGWEPGDTLYQTPIMWRYQMPLAEAASTGSAMVIDSLRLSPVTEHDATLSLTADESLDTVALGWQAVSSELGTDDGLAELSTYTHDEQTSRWLPALELPESIPLLAKQVFARHAVLSADGGTLLLTIPSDSSSTSQTRSGHVLVFR